jgi:hypothetical protein
VGFPAASHAPTIAPATAVIDSLSLRSITALFALKNAA